MMGWILKVPDGWLGWGRVKAHAHQATWYSSPSAARRMVKTYHERTGIKPEMVKFEYWVHSYAAHRANTRCPACNGNDLDMPCAYPGYRKAGCLRDARLGRTKNGKTG